MIDRKILGVFLVLLALSRSAFSQPKPDYDLKRCDTASSISLAEAEKRVREKGSVEIPPLARQSRLQGTVQIEVCVS